ncbi:DUF2812 domain-containing protein [Anaerovorax odorimutans]|uniref:DUF2812 domain-containing protein n=1 Tax=Anaerovorax odorimutans TaxID=109327 RepID=UPI0004252CAA|nr:DUF2812 domain-containing protein [Anaerovorax odorimutans]
MRTTKHRFEQFQFYDYTGIKMHLEKMALKGWKLHKITRLYWEYRKIEPKKLTYTVTYFSEASEFNPYHTDNQITFHEYCKNGGWNLVAEWAQMQIFCTEDEDITPIDTEESVKLKFIHKAMKKNFLPGNALLMLVSILQFFLQIKNIKSDLVYQLSTGSSLFLTMVWFLISIQTLYILIGYIVWYYKSKRSVNLGGLCAESGRVNKKISNLLLVITIVLLVLAMWTMQNVWAPILGIVTIIVVMTLVFAIKNALKREEVSRKSNIIITTVSCVILMFIFTSVLTWGIMKGGNYGLHSNKPFETYTTTQPDGSTYTWDIYHDPLPLKVEDLQEVNYEHYSYESTKRESFLVSQYIARQNSFPEGQLAPELNYAIVDVKLPVLFDICLKDYLEMYNYEWKKPDDERRYFKLTNDPLWHADAVYQLYTQYGSEGEYIVCWKNRIVYINYNKVPSVEQIAVTVKKLNK